MRIWSLFLAIGFTAIIMTLMRHEIGRVGVVVFFTGLGMCATALGGIMGMFQSLSAMAESNSPASLIESLVLLVLVVAVGSLSILTILFVGLLALHWALQ